MSPERGNDLFPVIAFRIPEGFFVGEKENEKGELQMQCSG